MKKYLALLLGVSLLMAGTLPNVSFAAGTENPAPHVIPAVTEWKGGTGKFFVTETTRLILEGDASLNDAKKDIIRGYFEDMLFVKTDFASGTAKDGDIIFKLSNDATLGDEGYEMEVDKTAVISGRTEISLLYGVITLIQSCCYDGYMPCGHVRDIPQYRIRSGMLDVARIWVPLDYVEDITKYFAWFKLNEIHLHINDNSADGNGYFRLESDLPGLTAENHYTKKEYREYQLRMREYGVSVVTEIDTPAHCKCFNKAVPELMLSDGRHLDISKPETLQMVFDLWDEYLLGDEPVFVGNTVHFGTDEYPAGHNEEMRAYTDALMKHIRSRGYTTRFWGSFGGDGFNGSTPVSGDSQCNYWAVELSDHKVLISMGYDIINTCGPILYCVPGGNGFADYFDLNSLYKNWQVNYLGIYNGKRMAEDDLQLLGACFAIWNDNAKPENGYSYFEVFDRVRYQVCLVAEKAWTGSKTAKISADDFVKRFDKLSLRAGNSDPLRRKYATDADIEAALGSGDAVSYGWPYCITLDFTPQSNGCTVASGKDGRLFVNAAGFLSFERGGVTFKFDRKVKPGEQNQIRLYGDRTSTLLVINNQWVSDPVEVSSGKKPAYSSSFVFPLENLGDENCKVDNITLLPDGQSVNELLYESNLALGKKVTVSGLEVNDGRLNEPMAVDGSLNTRVSFDRTKDVQWMIVDLGEIYEISKIVIHYQETVESYELYVSEDGENYTRIFEASGKDEGLLKTETITFDPVKARYVKYVQLKRWYQKAYNTYYSGGIREFEVYKTAFDYQSLLAEAEEIRDTSINLKIREIKRYLNSDRVFASHLQGLCDELRALIDAYNNPPEESADPVSEETSEPGSPVSQAEESVPESEESSRDETGGSGGALAPILIAAGVICIGAVCALIFKKKKKK